MPTYSYACTDCGNRFDVVQSFTDDALTSCDQCSGRLRKLFSPVGVVFKGSGFYRTDSRGVAKASTNGHNEASTSNGSGSDSGDKSGSTEKSTTSSNSSDTSTASSSSSSTATTAS